MLLYGGTCESLKKSISKVPRETGRGLDDRHWEIGKRLNDTVIRCAPFMACGACRNLGGEYQTPRWFLPKRFCSLAVKGRPARPIWLIGVV